MRNEQNATHVRETDEKATDVTTYRPPFLNQVGKIAKAWKNRGYTKVG